MSKKIQFLCFVLLLTSFSFQAFAARDEITVFSELEDRWATQQYLRRPKKDFYFDLAAIVTRDAKSIVDDAEDKANTNDVNIVSEFLETNINTEHQAFATLRIGSKISDFYLGTNIDWGLRVDTDFGISASIGDAFSFVTPFTNQDAVIQFYGKWEYSVGPTFEWKWNEYFSSGAYFNLTTRRDYFIQAQGQEIVADKDILNVQDAADNTQSFIYTDLHLTYTNKNFLSTILIEDIKVADISEKVPPGKNNFSSNIPRTRIHFEYLLEEVSPVNLNLFGGVVNRSYYDFGDNSYAGVEFIYPEFFLSNILMVDNIHVLVNPRISFDWIRFEFSYRIPIERKKDNFKRDDFWGLNLALNFDY